MGTIVVSATLISDAAAVEAGESPTIATSTHVFALDNADGLVTQGLEGVFPQIRALLGGTGQYSGAIGQVTEEVLGTNASGGRNLRFTFKLVRLNPQDNTATPAAAKQRVLKYQLRGPRRRG
jgi:hypothetical protein